MSNSGADADEIIIETDLLPSVPSEQLPDDLLVIPVNNRPFFPAQIQPLVLEADPWESTLEAVSKSEGKLVGLSFTTSDGRSLPEIDQIAKIGCVARIHHVAKEGGKIQFIAQGIARFEAIEWLNQAPPYSAKARYFKDSQQSSDEIKAYAIAVINSIKELLPLNPLYSEELRNYLNRFSPNEPGPLADFAAAITSADGAELQKVLETVPLLKRMERVLPLIKQELEVAKLHAQITKDVDRKIDEHQREFFLREQLKVIQEELGIVKDDATADEELFLGRIADKDVPEQAEKRIQEELNKLQTMPQGSPDYSVTRTYLDWITQIPWGVETDDNLDITHARETLDQDHAGLDDVKDRLIESLAVNAWRGEVSGKILLLVGPPGVGKTSIGKSIAESFGRKFYRFSVGGMRDEAEIKGHRRTYIGAMPGKFVQALKEVESMNPVIMLDEIDKIGNSYQGDPASALLEALDPEQNSEFLDHYTDLRVDLSKILFICTANSLDSIPGPLRDRCDIIRLSGYIAEEKLAIAKRHLWPRALEKAGVKPSYIKLSDATMKKIIEDYARESGVRNLDKLLNKLIGKAVVKLMKGESKPIRFTTKNLEEYLGSAAFKPEAFIQGIGVVTGLAWTSMGGATLPVEVTKVPAKAGSIKVTGQLGDVMKESASIAYSFLSANRDSLALDSDFFENYTIHLHVPEGATPKDGPSAGITIATALTSLARGKKLPRKVAMTGEMTLTGQVLPVGGIREKVIAARRMNISELLLPDANRGDFDELPEYLKEGVQINFVKHFKEVRDCLEI